MSTSKMIIPEHATVIDRVLSSLFGDVEWKFKKHLAQGASAESTDL